MYEMIQGCVVVMVFVSMMMFVHVTRGGVDSFVASIPKPLLVVDIIQMIEERAQAMENV